MAVAGAITQVISAASPSSGASWLSDLFKSLVAPALVAVLFTGMTNLQLERRRSRREAVTALMTGARVDLMNLQDLAVEYWSKPASTDEAVLAAKILASFEVASSSLKCFSAHKKIVLSNDLNQWLAELLDQLTGGDFQTAGRKDDPNRLRVICSSIAKMHAKIYDERFKNI